MEGEGEANPSTLVIILIKALIITDLHTTVRHKRSV